MMSGFEFLSPSMCYNNSGAGSLVFVDFLSNPGPHFYTFYTNLQCCVLTFSDIRM